MAVPGMGMTNGMCVFKIGFICEMNDTFYDEVIEFIKGERSGAEIVCTKDAPVHGFYSIFLPILNLSIVLIPLTNAQLLLPEAETNIEGKVKRVVLWEDLWRYQTQKVQSKLRSLLQKTIKIHGRSTKIVSIDNAVLTLFLKENHLNVPLKAKYKYGLMHDEELVAVMSFSKGRPMPRRGTMYQSFELLRYCSLLNITVVGGFGKLLNHFIKRVKPDDVMTYIDADWSGGESLSRFGFVCQGKTAPQQFLLDLRTGERVYPHRVHQLPKKVIKNTLESMNNSPDGPKEVLPALHDGILQVYNSGSYKYLLKLV